MVKLVDPYAAFSSRSLLTTLAWWEFDLYIGLLGAAVLLFFGLYRWLKRLGDPEGYPALLPPVILMFIFSMWSIFRFTRYIPIPLLQGERVTSRMIILPFLFVLLMASISLRAVRSRCSSASAASRTWVMARCRRPPRRLSVNATPARIAARSSRNRGVANGAVRGDRSPSLPRPRTWGKFPVGARVSV
jgi:hypothetical protein